MKLTHLTVFFLIIILPFSIGLRNNMNNYFVNLKDQVRLNNVIDIATQDALETLVELNDEFQMLYLNERFDITQTLAKESVKSFFKTMAINYNMPYIEGYTESYFSVYVPAIVIIGYDGFFIYSVDETSAGGYAYHMSPKIPYSYVVPGSDTVINFTLGNYIKIFINDRYYEGELTNDFYEQSLETYNQYLDAYGGVAYADDLLRDIDSLTSDMSVILTTLNEKYYGIIPDFLYASSGDGDIPLTKDYDSTDAEPSAFHKLRREVIIELVRQTLQQEINSHETYAKIMGSNYDFSLPEIANDDWTNSINDISVMSFIQGMPIGIDAYYNNYALGGSRIIQTDYIYGTVDKNYHSNDCELISHFFSEHTVPGGIGDDGTVDNVFVNRVQAAEYGYYPCVRCHP